MFDDVEMEAGDMPMLRKTVQIPRAAVTRPARWAAEMAVLYILLCSTYILISGYFAVRAAATPHQLYVTETIKGVAFIFATGIAFFVISYLRCRKIRHQEETIIAQETALIHAEKRLIAAMSAATMAHDLNNLLSALSGFVEELKSRRESIDPVLSQMSKDLDVDIDKLSHLAKRLVSVVGRAVPDKEEAVDLQEALHELIAVVRRHPDGRYCRISLCNIASLTVVLNRTLFEEAVLNLLINAAQAAGQQGKIEVHLTAGKDAATLAVHDNGPGVPEDVVTDIFEPCFTTKSNGSGIGLLAVKAFAVSCGADVSVGRSPLGGALFQIRIPT